MIANQGRLNTLIFEVHRRFAKSFQWLLDVFRSLSARILLSAKRPPDGLWSGQGSCSRLCPGDVSRVDPVFMKVVSFFNEDLIIILFYSSASLPFLDLV